MKSTLHKKILVVDDSPTILKILSKGIESLGYSVVQATDGAEALEVLNSEIDLVMTDLNMPNLNGYQLIRHIRGMPEYSVLPVIVLTSEAGDKAMGQALDSGANIYLRKPASLPKLKYKVQSLLGVATPLPETEALIDSTLEEHKEAAEALEGAQAYRRQTEKLKMVSPDIQIEMYLFADGEVEAQMILHALAENRELTSSDVLPFLMDDSLQKLELIRLFHLMSALKHIDYALPLLHMYPQLEDVALKAELIKTAGRCGGADFIHDIEELYHTEASTTISMNEETRTLLGAFEKALEFAATHDDD